MERVQPGEPAFDFSYPDSDGNMVSLSDFKGKLVFLDLWASWCSPCFEEFPYMRDLQEKFSNEDFVMIGIGLDEEKSTWEYTLSQNELPWIQLYGGGELENDLFRKYQAGVDVFFTKDLLQPAYIIFCRFHLLKQRLYGALTFLVRVKNQLQQAAHLRVIPGFKFRFQIPGGGYPGHGLKVMHHLPA
jgi:thiol-disulfide isomerase/thioredoxin